MAISKQPPFPDPPLEVGIAQYPTPLVPDYYTKDGHIILVEKVSIEKGNYNPQPLDGSVIYSKRDANDWPENLYLVFQQTEPTGKFIFNYWANDRTLASQDPWNYGIDYSLDDPTKPIYTREYIVPRSQYSAVSIGSVDPVFGGTAKISQQSMRELEDGNPLRSRYVLVQRVYETIPSSAISGQSVNKYGSVDTTIKQVVLPSTTASTSQTQGQIAGVDQFLVSDAINPVSAAKSEEQKVVMSQPPSVVTYEITHDLAIVKTITDMILRENLTPPAIPGTSGNTALLDVKDEDVGFPWIMRSSKSLMTDSGGNVIVPPPRVEFKTINYEFPGIIYSWQARQGTTEDEVTTSPTANLSFFNNRYPLSLTVSARHVITYHTSAQDLSNLEYFSVITQPWALKFFDIPRNMIHPPAPVTLRGQSVTSGGIDILISGGQGSAPSNYIPGQEILIGGDCELWQGGIYMKQLIYVKEPPTTL
jgi:hypothetical protein